MKVPFGLRLASDETELLVKLGFNLEGMEKIGRYYFLNIPDSPRIRFENNTTYLGLMKYKIYYNNVEVISITHRDMGYGDYVNFEISASSVEKALAKNDEITEEQLREERRTAIPTLTREFW